MRGRVPGRLVHLPAAEVGLDLDAGHQVAVGQHDLGDARSLAPCAPPGRPRAHSGGTPLWRATSSRRSSQRAGSSPRCGHVLVVRVHPQLAPGALDDRRRQAVVVGVRVGADHQPHVLHAQARPGRARARAARNAPGSCEAGVDEHDAVAGGNRLGVHVRNAGPGQRQPQAPDAGQDPVGAASSRRRAIGRSASLAGPGRSARPDSAPGPGRPRPSRRAAPRRRARGAGGRTRAGDRGPRRGGG